MVQRSGSMEIIPYGGRAPRRGRALVKVAVRRESVTMRLLIMIVGSIVLVNSGALGIGRRGRERADRGRGGRERFGGTREAPARERGLIVEAKNDPGKKNARGGKPMNIAGKQF